MFETQELIGRDSGQTCRGLATTIEIGGPIFLQQLGRGGAAGSAPAFASRRVVTADGVTQPYGLCEFGHQGLMHDEELPWGHGGGLIHNRARTLHPRLGRFMQRDPLGYVGWDEFLPRLALGGVWL